MEDSSYNRICTVLEGCGGILAAGCVPSQNLHLADAVTRDDRVRARAKLRLIITYGDKRAQEIRQEFSFYDRNTVYFPAKDLIFYQADIRGREIEKERIRCL